MDANGAQVLLQALPAEELEGVLRGCSSRIFARLSPLQHDPARNMTLEDVFPTRQSLEAVLMAMVGFTKDTRFSTLF
jgi:hypothetical protein